MNEVTTLSYLAILKAMISLTLFALPAEVMSLYR